MRRKRLFASAVVVFALALAVSVYYVMLSSVPIENTGYYPDNNDNGGPLKLFDIRLPWEPSNPTNRDAGAGSGGGGSGSSSSDSSSTGSSNSPGTNSPEVTLPKNNFTLFINSTHNLSVRVLYTNMGMTFDDTFSLPSSVDAQEGTHVCLAESTNSGTIRWLMDDGLDCPFSECGGGLYDCDILMNRNLSITLRQYS
jgi:hypothetical protein